MSTMIRRASVFSGDSSPRVHHNCRLLAVAISSSFSRPHVARFLAERSRQFLTELLCLHGGRARGTQGETVGRLYEGYARAPTTNPRVSRARSPRRTPDQDGPPHSSSTPLSLRFVSLPPSLSTARTRFLYLFFFLTFFFHSTLPSLRGPSGFFPFPRAAPRRSPLFRRECVNRKVEVCTRMCVGTHRGMRDSVAMELPARPAFPPPVGLPA